MMPPDKPESSIAGQAPARPRSWVVLFAIVGISVLAGWVGRRLQDSRTTDPGANELRAADADSPTKTLSQGAERTLTPEQKQLAALGFEAERRPYPVPKLTIEDASGNSRSLADLGGSWVILEFWSVSCEPCRRSLSALERLSKNEIGEHVTILPVCVDADDARTAQEVLSQIAPDLCAYVESDGIGIAQFGVEALPMTWLIGPDGQVRATHAGRIEWDSNEVLAALRKVLLRSLPADNF